MFGLEYFCFDRVFGAGCKEERSGVGSVGGGGVGNFGFVYDVVVSGNTFLREY